MSIPTPDTTATIADADSQARRNERVSRNIPLVRQIAGRFVGRGIDRDDLEQEGTIGLMEAVARDDPDRGHWPSFAAMWIKAPMRVAIRNGSMVRVPEMMIRKLARTRRDQAMADALSGGAKFRLAQAARALANRGRGCEGYDLGLAAAHEEPETVDVEAITSLVDAIPSPRGRQIIIERFGLGGVEPRLLREIGADLGINPSSTYKLEASTLAWLREEATRRGFDYEDLVA